MRSGLDSKMKSKISKPETKSPSSAGHINTLNVNYADTNCIYPDGRVVMMRTGNYIWPKDILRLDKFVMNPQNIPQFLDDIDSTLPEAQQLALWIAEDDHIARAAYEVSEDRPRLIGIAANGSTEFPGVDELLSCHTTRDGFTFSVDNERT